MQGSCWHWAILGDLGDPPPTPVFWGSHSRKRGFFLIGLLRVDLCATVDPGYTHSSLSASSFEDNCTTLEPPPPRQTCASQHPLPDATKVSPTKVSPGQPQACAKFCLLQPERQEKCKAHRAKRMHIASSLLYRHVKERSPCPPNLPARLNRLKQSARRSGTVAPQRPPLRASYRSLCPTSVF